MMHLTMLLKIALLALWQAHFYTSANAVILKHMEKLCVY